MKQRPVTDGLSVTEIGLGTSQFGNLGRVVSDEEAASALNAAWDAGIRYFDTAPHYGIGLAERRLGELLQSRPRDEYLLSTKVGRLLEPSGDVDPGLDDAGFVVPATHRRVLDYSADGVRRSLEASLERMRLDRIDIVYIHDPDEHWEQASREAVPALVQLRDEGVIGSVGVGMNQSEMLTKFVEQTDVDVVMCAGRYTLLEQPAAEDLLPAAIRRGVSVVIAGIYNSGLLAAPRPRSGATYNYAPADGELVARANRLADICENHGVTLPDAAVAFPLLRPAVSSVVVGCRNGEQVRAAIERYSSRISDDLWADLSSSGLIDHNLTTKELP